MCRPNKRYPSPPEYSLTSRHDKAWNKAIITKSHSVGKGKDSPGFIYDLPEESRAAARATQGRCSLSPGPVGRFTQWLVY